MGDVAGHGDDHVGGPVGADQKSWMAAVGIVLIVRLVAADLAAERSVPEHRLLEEDLGVLDRVVVVGADLLDDDRALVVDLRIGEHGPHDELAEDVHPARRLAPGDPDPVDGRFAVGRRVERAADALDRLGDRPPQVMTFRPSAQRSQMSRAGAAA